VTSSGAQLKRLAAAYRILSFNAAAAARIAEPPITVEREA
jgi:hypothetical protein